MDTPWLSEREQQSWRRLVAVLELLPGVLDSQLGRDANLTHFDYFVLSMLSEAPDRTLQMTKLAGLTNATLARLSNVVRRLETRGLVHRQPGLEDRRTTNVVLTDDGWDKVVRAAPGHVRNVRSAVLKPLTPAQVDQLSEICGQLLESLDPDHQMVGHDRPPSRAE